MTIDRPTREQLPELRQLWKEAFGDGDAFLDIFFSTGFSPDRCRCVTLSGSAAAALYWFDTWLDGKKLAYLYAIATGKAHRGKGLCRALMANTHKHLRALGYAGCLLVPASTSLFDFYGSMGYRTVSTIREFTACAEASPLPLRQVCPEEYAARRRKLLLPGSVLQEGTTLAFLSAQAELYAGDGLLLVAQRDGEQLFVPELLGDPGCAPAVLKALNAEKGTFRTPGRDKPFAMGLSLTETPLPDTYFGLALD